MCKMYFHQDYDEGKSGCLNENIAKSVSSADRKIFNSKVHNYLNLQIP